MKYTFTAILILIAINISAQNIRRYASDYAIKFTISEDEKRDGGAVKDIMKEEVLILHNKQNSTIEIKFVEQDLRIFFFKNVKFYQKFTEKGDVYNSYTANIDGDPYFISFGKNMIKVDNRKKYKGFAFHLK
ncbi:hypothetical protein [Marinifilum fragile]|uniref:hypothetical protein n=1 Tax=Marinifilum fragile TaxID=570161 RepID=UPI002AAAAE1E|nr:hypothetical protein [Marinifilum fragile]